MTARDQPGSALINECVCRRDGGDGDLLLPLGTSVGSERLPDMSEMYYALAEEATVTVDSERAT